MGSLIRSMNWNDTNLGDPGEWPQSLRTTLSILLNSKFPMFLFWGREFICFYNDAYRPSLGNDGKHPSILGMRGEEAWPEIWSIIKPLIDQVMSGGEATWHENQLIPIYRNGKIEDVYWTFSYSPVSDESGNIAGVFVTCNETTEQVLSINRLEQSEKNFRNLVDIAPFPAALYRGKDLVIELANEEVLKLWGRDKNVIGKTLAKAMPELEGQPFLHLLQEVYSTGKTYEGKEIPAWIDKDGKIEMVYYNLIYKALYDTEGKISGILAMGYDVSEQLSARKKVAELEERTRLAVDAALFGTFDKNMSTGTSVYSKRLYEIFGFEVANARPEDFDNRVHPDDAHVVEKANAEALRTGTTHYQFRIILPDKSIRWIDMHGKYFFDESKQPARYIGIASDITEQKASRQRIEESEEKFRSLSNSVPQLVWTANASGEMNYYNEAVFEYTGLTLQDLFGEGWMKIVHPDDREENMRRWLESIGSGKPYLFEHRLQRHDGEYRWQLSRALPQKDAEGKIQMWVGTSTDIDEIKKHDQQKDDFIKMASHELKTPVTTIKGYVQLLMNTHSDSSDKLLSSSLSTINRQISKLTKLITDLLDVTRIETGSLQLNKEHFSLNSLVSEITADIQTTTSTHQLILDLQPDVTIYADLDRISQVLMNLLTNAIKYSPRADKVIIKTRVSSSDVTVSIRDFGIGVFNKDYEKIFERFYRVEGKDEKTFPGFGIGLFIVKEIISQHEGRVWVESEKDSGSVFYFSLPII
jgi:PAS domain S-box-containing protein